MSVAAPARYRRLPGRPPLFRLATNSTSVLWLGDEHLLQVESVYFTDRYKRFSYGDIQALLMRETPRALAANATFGVIAAGCALIAWGAYEAAVRGFFVGGAVFWTALLGINLLRGRTCRCHLQTAAGPHRLPSLSRVRPTRRALALLAAKIEAAQGVLTPEDLARLPGAGAGVEPVPRVNEFDY